MDLENEKDNIVYIKSNNLQHCIFECSFTKKSTYPGKANDNYAKYMYYKSE